MYIMSVSQKRNASTLIKEECANYMQGQCLPLDSDCAQVHSYSLICKYFADCVLPLDKQLHDEITGVEGQKKCAVCGKPFRAVSNRAKYCIACAPKERKRRELQRQREVYASVKKTG